MAPKTPRPRLRLLGEPTHQQAFRRVTRTHFTPEQMRGLRANVRAAIPGLREAQETELRKVRVAIAKERKTGDSTHADQLERSMVPLLEHHLRLLAQPRLGYLPLLVQEFALRALERRLDGRLPDELRALHQRVIEKKRHLWSVA